MIGSTTSNQKSQEYQITVSYQITVTTKINPLIQYLITAASKRVVETMWHKTQ